MATITPDMKAGDIARRWPETMKVFARYSLDLRCGGVHPLEFAAQKHGFNLEKMLEELNAVLSSAPVQAR
jgi:iron-sulfur cluster repair protein YtfE (RIC family)